MISVERRKTLVIWAKVIVAAVLLALIFFRINFAELSDQLASVSLFAVLVAFAVNFFALVWATLKWFLLLDGSVRFKRLLEMNLIGTFYGTVLPGQIAGEAAKAVLLSKSEGWNEKFALSVLLDKLTGLLGLLLLGLVGALCSTSALPKEIVLSLAAAIFALTLLLLLGGSRFAAAAVERFVQMVPGKIGARAAGFVRKMSDGWRMISRSTPRISFITLLGFAYQVFGVMAIMMFSTALGIEVGFFDWCWILAALSVVVLLPVTIAGLGLREGTLIGLLAILGVPTEKALSLGLLVFTLQLSLAFLGGILVLRPLPRR